MQEAREAVQRGVAAAKRTAIATEKLAKTAKLKGEIIIENRHLIDLKKNAGPDIFDAWRADDKEKLQALFQTLERRIDAVEKNIETKLAAVEALKAPADSFPAPDYVATNNAQQTSTSPQAWGAPPPDPPPTQSQPASTLPDGWKKAMTPEGKEYYYNKAGETSWTVPGKPDLPEA